MSVNAVSGAQNLPEYNAYSTATSASAKTDDSQAVKETVGAGAVYERAESTAGKKATYSVNKMTAADREALVRQLRAEQDSRKQSLVNLVQEMMGKQVKSYGMATGNDSIWKFLAKGDFTVDAQTKAQAQADIAEDGYWGVSQTSQRLFDFASALAGDDVEKMKEMQEAMQKGFGQAQKTWGGKLPDISQRTMDAANRLFEDYYASKQNVEA